MKEFELYKMTLKHLLLLCLAFLCVRFTDGVFLVVLSLIGLVYGLKGAAGKAFSINMAIIFMVIMNPIIMPKGGAIFGIGARLGSMLISLSLACKGMLSSNKYRLPFGLLLAYLVIATISSAQGWAPTVSFLKLINFLVFFIGIWFGTQRLAIDPNETAIVRATMLALSSFLVLGSAALIPFPSISTLEAITDFRDIVDREYVQDLVMERIANGGMSLFCGVTFQSQTLAPLLSCVVAWLACDLLFVEKKIRWLHVILLVVSLPLLYKTRSRVAFTCLVVICLLIYFYLPKRMALDRQMKSALGMVLLISGSLILSVAIMLEVKDDSMSKWIRKTNDVGSDMRSLKEAFTSSRQGLIEMCMDDFRRNPFLGMGFQVSYKTMDQLKGRSGLILSAPIEKGLLPVMVLGESGCLGAFVFLIFLITYFIGCSNRRLYISNALMAVLLATNIGEACFFSPGGAGGIEWMVTIVGGYSLDMVFIYNRKRGLYQLSSNW